MFSLLHSVKQDLTPTHTVGPRDAGARFQSQVLKLLRVFAMTARQRDQYPVHIAFVLPECGLSFIYSLCH